MLFATESVLAILTGPVNVDPDSAAPPKFASAPEAVDAAVPPAVMGTVLVPDSVLPVPL